MSLEASIGAPPTMGLSLATTAELINKIERHKYASFFILKFLSRWFVATCTR